jgi:hypothetical protein
MRFFQMSMDESVLGVMETSRTHPKQNMTNEAKKVCNANNNMFNAIFVVVSLVDFKIIMNIMSANET